MNAWLCAAAIVGLLVAIIHSVLGEILIFKALRSSGVVPTQPAPPLRQRHVRILWASWHLASVFGCGLAILLWAVARDGQLRAGVLLDVAIGAFFGAGVLVLLATRGRHPGWIGLCAVAALTCAGRAFAVPPL